MFGRRKRGEDQRIESLLNELDYLYFDDAMLLAEGERFREIQSELQQLGVQDDRPMPFMMARADRIEVLKSQLRKIDPKHEMRRENLVKLIAYLNGESP